MTEFTTSAVYDVWDVLTARMRNVSWPAPPDGTQDNVAVWFGDPRQPNVDEHGNPPNATECVVVVSMVETPDTEWGAIGQLAREEQFRIPVFVETLLQGRDSAEVRLRLQQLTSAIEADIRLVQAGARTGAHQPDEFFKYERWNWAVSSVKPLVLGGEAGYVGQAEVVIECSFRVNKPHRTE